LLNERILKDRLAAGKKYFVRQTYPRGLKDHHPAAFLIRAYETSEKELAQTHLMSLANDTDAFLYDAGDPGHLKRLMIAARQPGGFTVYYAGKKTIAWKPPALYQQKVKQYLQANHPAWRTKKGGDKIQVGLYEEFGRLFLKFSFQGEDDRVSLEQIEKM
jgi:hypothetical protein